LSNATSTHTLELVATKGFGARLRAARSEAGMSQSDLERLSGVPKTRLSRYENGHILPSLVTLRKLAVALGIPESRLLGERSVGDELLEALRERGVRVSTPKRARELADVLADAVQRRPSLRRARS